MTRREPDGRRRLAVLALWALMLGLPDAGVAQVRPGGGPTMEQAQGERYDGPKARIAVADFEDKMSSTGHYRAEYGRGMADMLATSLFNTNRYIVLERQKLTYVLAEQDLGASGRMKRETAAPIGELEGAELLVVAAVTGFDPGASGGGGGVGGVVGSLFGSRAGQAAGAVAGGFRRAHIALDLRVIDTKTGRVVAGNSVQGSATEVGGSLGVADSAFGGALGGFARTPMERAIRDAIQASVDFVVKNTPTRYYRGPAAPAPPPVASAAPPGVGVTAPAAPAATASGPAPATSRADPATPPPAPQVASIPPKPASASPPTPSIAVDRNPKLTAELTDARQRGAVVSVTVTVKNPTESPQRLQLTGTETYLLDYADGTKHALIGCTDSVTSSWVPASRPCCARRSGLRRTWTRWRS